MNEELDWLSKINIKESSIETQIRILKGDMKDLIISNKDDIQKGFDIIKRCQELSKFWHEYNKLFDFNYDLIILNADQIQESLYKIFSEKLEGAYEIEKKIY